VANGAIPGLVSEPHFAVFAPEKFRPADGALVESLARQPKESIAIGAYKVLHANSSDPQLGQCCSAFGKRFTVVYHLLSLFLNRLAGTIVEAYIMIWEPGGDT
jgi:hypothetical protein